MLLYLKSMAVIIIENVAIPNRKTKLNKRWKSHWPNFIDNRLEVFEKNLYWLLNRKFPVFNGTSGWKTLNDPKRPWRPQMTKSVIRLLVIRRSWRFIIHLNMVILTHFGAFYVILIYYYRFWLDQKRNHSKLKKSSIRIFTADKLVDWIFNFKQDLENPIFVFVQKF